MKLIVVFGKFTKDVAEMVGKHEVIKTETNLDALLAFAGKIEPPEVLLTDGSVLSGLVEGKINRSSVMLDKISKIRRVWPKTKIVLVLPEDAPDNLIQGIVSLGIYNVYKKKTIKKDDLLCFIEQDKNFSEVITPVMPEVEGNHKSQLILEPQELNENKPSNSVFHRLKDKVWDFVTVQNPSDFNSSEKDKMDQITCMIDGALIKCDLNKVFDRLNNNREFEAIFLPSNLPNIKKLIQDIRRNTNSQRIVIVGLGNCGHDLIGASGLDECFPSLTPEVLRRIQAKAEKLKLLWDKANTDELTGCYQRNFMGECFAYALQKYREKKELFSILAFDLNDFKRINDTHGHNAGDEVLRSFGEHLRKNCRKGDIPIRTGGDEFILLTPSMDRDRAQEIGQRIKKNWKNPYQCTASMGYAQVGTDGETQSQLLETADRRMYAEKTAARKPVHPLPGSVGTLGIPHQLEERVREGEIDLAAHLVPTGRANYRVQNILGSYCHIFQNREVVLHLNFDTNPILLQNADHDCPILRLTSQMAVLQRKDGSLLLFGRNGKIPKKTLKLAEGWW